MAAILGLDLGEKRVGVAFADSSAPVATPLKTLTIRGKKHLLEELKLIIEEYQISEIVVGLPKTLQGEIGPAAGNVMETVEWLKARMDLIWHLWDERLTTAEVEKFLVGADVSRAQRKDVRDKLAAQKILQTYLDAQKNKQE